MIAIVTLVVFVVVAGVIGYLVVSVRRATEQVAKLEAEKAVQSFRTEAIAEAAAKTARLEQQAAADKAALVTASDSELERIVNE